MVEVVQETSSPAEAGPSDESSGSSLRIRPDLYNDEYSDEQYAEMMELYEGTLQSIVEGEIVKSKVMRVTDTHVILDVGFKSEGAVPIEQFKNASSISAGDEVEVFLENLEDEHGSVVRPSWSNRRGAQNIPDRGSRGASPAAVAPGWACDRTRFN